MPSSYFLVLVVFTASIFLLCASSSLAAGFFFFATVSSEEPPPPLPQAAVLTKSKSGLSQQLVTHCSCHRLYYVTLMSFTQVCSLYPMNTLTMYVQLINSYLCVVFFLCVCPEPCYDPVNEDDNHTSAGLKRLSLRKTGSMRALKIKPSVRVSGSKQGSTSSSGHNQNSEPSLIDFGEEFLPSTSCSSPVVEIQIPFLAKLALEAENILDRTPPQSPSKSLPRPLHPTPIVDWDARPLPPPPAYDDVAQDEDDMEV